MASAAVTYARNYRNQRVNAPVALFKKLAIQGRAGSGGLRPSAGAHTPRTTAASGDHAGAATAQSRRHEWES